MTAELTTQAADQSTGITTIHAIHSENLPRSSTP